MKHIFTVLLFLSVISALHAQSPQRSYKGRVVDSASLKPLADATISVFRASDTLLLNFGFTTPNGNFTLNVKSNDSILIVISLFGYNEVTKKDAAREDGWMFMNFGDVKLSPQPFSLKGYTMKTSAIRMKGDTIEINASRFKVMPGSDVAQLFKKIPGFEVSVKGEIKVNGSPVTKIMVDGSDFFGNNPGMVSKNLTADMIETVQVFEERNPDGTPLEESSKVINLKLKKGKRNGTFGDLLAGYGTENRYESGLRMNNFKNDRKFSFIVNSNNINETGFDFGFGNWHNATNIRRNGSDNDGFYSTNSGEGNINHKTGAGFTYFNEYSGKRKISLNVYANRNDYSSISSSQSINPLNDSTRRVNRDSSNTAGLALSSSFEFNYSKDIDSTGDYDFGITGRYSDNKSTKDGLNDIRLNEILLNAGNSTVQNETESNMFKATASLYRVLRKNRNYNFFVSSSYQLNNDNNRFFQYVKNDNDTFNNLNERNVSGSEWLSKATGQIPVYKLLRFSVSLDRWEQVNRSVQLTNAASNRYSNIFEQAYENKIDSLSVQFTNKQVQNSIKPFFSIRGKHFYTQAGVTYLNMTLTNSDETGKVLFTKSYPKLLPFYSLSYYPNKAYLFLTLSKTVNFPQISDLLPVLNLSNNYERRSGNPELQPVDNYSFRTYTSLYKLKGFKYFYFGANGSLSDNTKIWVNTQDETGIILKKPENAEGKRTGNVWINMSKKISKILNFELNAHRDYQKNPMVINGSKAFGINQVASLEPAINFSYADSLELSLGMNWNRNNFKNTLNNSLNYVQDVYAYSFEMRALLKTGTEINTGIDISDQRNVPGIGRIVPVWNAFIQQPLGSKSPFNIKLSAYDILKQNTSISRYTMDNFIYINQSNRLQRYFMLTLVYKIKKVGAADEGRDYVY